MGASTTPAATKVAPKSGGNSSGQGKDAVIPDGVKGWSFGAFLLNWIWSLGNKTWIGLLTLVPFVGFIMAIVLGIKGREWAWQNKKWDSVEHFNSVQKKWSLWSLGLLVIPFVIAILAGMLMPALSSARDAAVEAQQQQELGK